MCKLKISIKNPAAAKNSYLEIPLFFNIIILFFDHYFLQPAESCQEQLFQNAY